HGYVTTGELLQLNSYENRVFDVRLEPGKNKDTNIIAKFYRPLRWDIATLNEEHTFVEELVKAGVPCVGAHKLKTFVHSTNDNIFYSLYPKKVGRMPQEFLPGQLKQVGKWIAQLHNVGAQKKFKHRATMGAENYIPFQSLDILEEFVQQELWSRYSEAAENIMSYLDDTLDPKSFLRIHGDCHKGNLLHDGETFFFVDFDDSFTGPAVQDFWMLLSSAGEEGRAELDELLDGYSELRDFNDDEIELIPALRGLRTFSYSAWIANRWSDPVFRKIFPDFRTYNYWADEVERLESIAWSL
ncbi:MAG: serine/threonine protein kinase, partial [Bdellovibrionaceae bacterium]|nr:serine/threonine protein kinase [Pseudobdellovibrionaceae bacterium]